MTDQRVDVVEPWVRDALDRGLPQSQLELQFQPVVRLDGSGVYGAETFLRWRHPERGLLRAVQWLPYATRSGAAVALSASVLPAWAACARRVPGLVLSFNVTAQDLGDDGYMASMLAVAADDGASLAVEVWNWLELADLASLASLQALGVSVWLDDFGDGTDDEATALGSTVDVVKLDRSLLGWTQGQLAGLTGRLHQHGKIVLVEGVESAEHERLAIESGADLASGYRYARPLREQEFMEYLAS